MVACWFTVWFERMRTGISRFWGGWMFWRWDVILCSEIWYCGGVVATWLCRGTGYADGRREMTVGGAYSMMEIEFPSFSLQIWSICRN